MAKHYISNSTDSPRMFKSNLLEPLSKVNYTVPLYIFVPIIAFCIYHDFANLGVQLLAFIGYFIIGLFIWTFTEYIMHRFVFHFKPHGKIMERIHFVFHGVHHDYPRDAKRLVLPASVSIPLATIFYFLFKMIFPVVALY